MFCKWEILCCFYRKSKRFLRKVENKRIHTSHNTLETCFENRFFLNCCRAAKKLWAVFFFFLFRSVNNAWSHVLFVYGNIRYIISELVSSLSWGNIFRRKNVLYRCYTDLKRVLSTWRMSLHVKWRFRNSLYFECNSRTWFNIFPAKNNNISFFVRWGLRIGEEACLVG